MEGNLDDIREIGVMNSRTKLTTIAFENSIELDWISVSFVNSCQFEKVLKHFLINFNKLR